MNEVITMSKKEIDRVQILKKVQNKELKQIQAAKILNISDRQVRNLLTNLKSQGLEGIASKKRGKPSNRQKNPILKAPVLDLIKRKYIGFGPTLAAEKLNEWEGIQLSNETVRQWMLQKGFWIERHRRRKQIHLPRARRECFGELIQVDGSHHRWFGDDGPQVNLTVFIDDATSLITALYFTETENLTGYTKALEQHLHNYGRPRAIYADRSSICQPRQGKGKTQFHRMLQDLEIQLILANSPQAKGRVERVNRTLQDRLIKEMALAGIDSIEKANKFVDDFRQKYNEKFSRDPVSSYDAHRSLEGYDLPKILRKHEQRTLMNEGIFQYKNCFYKIQNLIAPRRSKGRKVDLYIEGSEFRVYLKGKEYNACLLCEVDMAPVMSRKEVLHWKDKKPLGCPRGSSWRRFNPNYLSPSLKSA